MGCEKCSTQNHKRFKVTEHDKTDRNVKRPLTSLIAADVEQGQEEHINTFNNHGNDSGENGRRKNARGVDLAVWKEFVEKKQGDRKKTRGCEMQYQSIGKLFQKIQRESHHREYRSV